MKVFLRFFRAFSLQRFDRADFLPFGRAVFLIGFRAVDFRGEVFPAPTLVRCGEPSPAVVLEGGAALTGSVTLIIGRLENGLTRPAFRWYLWTISSSSGMCSPDSVTIARNSLVFIFLLARCFAIGPLHKRRLSAATLTARRDCHSSGNSYVYRKTATHAATSQSRTSPNDFSQHSRGPFRAHEQHAHFQHSSAQPLNRFPQIINYNPAAVNNASRINGEFFRKLSRVFPLPITPSRHAGTRACFCRKIHTDMTLYHLARADTSFPS